MAEGQERIELKFRIYDGTDIGHTSYASSTTIAFLKQRLIAEWPQGKTIAPKLVNDIKLIHAGKILDNSKTLADSKVTFGDLPSSVITMHVVVQPHVAKKKTDKNKEEKQNQNSCSFFSLFYLFLISGPCFVALINLSDMSRTTSSRQVARASPRETARLASDLKISSQRLKMEEVLKGRKFRDRFHISHSVQLIYSGSRAV
ncbi:hypothetical protein Ddye_016830 [Dipteronia dyeriana]|uniref:Ubiquitin-like domain-containing protein n=1 Tax=Dipteronia dyeriana TaxID=168575 RepID=A0AAD9U841_9ROSI|nr:hypothetical protein Ddye_016830 [Dipteronia dyeriana]